MVYLSFYDVGNLRANPFEKGKNDRVQGASIEITSTKDPLEGIGRPMTSLRAKKLKQALQGLLMDLQEEEALWAMVNTLLNIITYL